MSLVTDTPHPLATTSVLHTPTSLPVSTDAFSMSIPTCSRKLASSPISHLEPAPDAWTSSPSLRPRNPLSGLWSHSSHFHQLYAALPSSSTLRRPIPGRIPVKSTPPTIFLPPRITSDTPAARDSSQPSPRSSSHRKHLAFNTSSESSSSEPRPVASFLSSTQL
ncbi:unnamed protein product [Cyclocybe aegerita]|uniref:Uncharacterized protein n=1 Tax=Cyclocybe aegerita TaxID=1973307 RepID=A0A8S0WT19_CYCAE|nr:unnamed protein product [Cyclocybe aegerita]